ncbi:Phosphate uptake regulator [Pyrobaculum oguniense TE7]|uniref:Phosphate uptake regulator n=1 Tax=Pyrobaculum oguniense (strain DSM 13380 / JCM 10595 / TE7) TaxID=698757 RepID=H6Q914_PYROT|nr:Phosphate uptake regulator [Pyrobaculum oguniense TE7]
MRVNWYVRKLQKIRHGSYVISLPPEWVSKEGLRPHNELYLITNDGCLFIYLPYEFDSVSVDVTNIDNTVIKYLILTYYMQGASEIYIYSQGPLPAETKRFVKEVVRKLRNSDITDMGLTYMFVKFKDETPFISLNDFLEEVDNMFKFVVNAVNDLIDGLINDNSIIIKEVIERTEDFDRNYRYMIRIISKMAQFPQYNVFSSPRELIAYAALSKDLSRAVYHLSKVAEHAMDSDIINNEALILTRESYNDLYKFYKTQNLELVAHLRHNYAEIKRRLAKSANFAEYELRRLAAYSIALMDDILNIYLVPPKKKKLIGNN